LESNEIHIISVEMLPSDPVPIASLSFHGLHAVAVRIIADAK
jgi:hypothetical protein